LVATELDVNIREVGFPVPASCKSGRPMVSVNCC